VWKQDECRVPFGKKDLRLRSKWKSTGNSRSQGEMGLSGREHGEEDQRLALQAGIVGGVGQAVAVAWLIDL
jgi:hypothetical protein